MQSITNPLKITRSLIRTIIVNQESNFERSTGEDMEDLLSTWNETTSWLISRYILGKFKINLEECDEETKKGILDNFIYLLVHYYDTLDENEIYNHLYSIKIDPEEYENKNDFNIAKDLQINILNVLDYYVNDNYLDVEDKDRRVKKIIEIIASFILEIHFNKNIC